MMIMVVAIVAALFLIVSPGLSGQSASAAVPQNIGQCNGDYDGAGGRIACDVVVNNYLDVATGVTSSTTVTTLCQSAAGVILPTSSCTVTSIPSLNLITSVTQCNDNGNGGGGQMVCNVTIVNHIVGAATYAGVTVKQCQDSESGGVPICDPVQNTTDATVQQCNGSANGDGGLVTCTVTIAGEGAALPVSVNQCNGSENGGGSTVTCTYAVSNIVTAAVVVPPVVTPPATTPPAATTPSPTAEEAARQAAAARELASTGANDLPLALGGLITLMLGAGLIMIAARRRAMKDRNDLNSKAM
ncbi:LPXTG cell wall anchor domain-containing protein [Lacisediminihabitans sp.]|uniref:LPXTG cell wall anchor domain-containing protein n=1 Tax=Lacisediminihabitans sp. TaxID=2787631 RepID=UPI002ED849B6